jgi:ElaB/YqjD/DUF883 family membrane-anchored ribosome-binding protein
MSEYRRHIEGGMPPTGGEMVPGNTEAGVGKTTEQIEREIEQTRDRMSENIDALGDKLSPENLKRQAKERVAGKAHDMVQDARESVQETGSRVVDFIRDNPLPVVAMGLGAVWLFQQRNRSEVSGDRMARFAYTGPERRSSPVGRGIAHRVAERAADVKDTVAATATTVAERASDLADRAREQAQHLGWRAREQSRRARGGFSRLLEDNPLALVAGATVLGLAVGLLTPETERENRLMGPTRDDLIDRAQTTAQRVKEVAVEAGKDATEVLREEVAQRGPEIKATLQGAAENVGAEVKEAAARVKEEAKRAVKGSPKERGTDAG